MQDYKNTHINDDDPSTLTCWLHGAAFAASMLLLQALLALLGTN